MSDNNDEGDPPVSEPLANIVDQLLGSSAALQALGRELDPIIASAISTANSASSNTHTVNTHSTPLSMPGMFPYSASYMHSGLGDPGHPPYSPYGWSQYGPQGQFQYGPRDRFQHGPHDRFQYGLHDQFQHGPQDPQNQAHYGPWGQFEENQLQDVQQRSEEVCISKTADRDQPSTSARSAGLLGHSHHKQKQMKTGCR